MTRSQAIDTINRLHSELINMRRNAVAQGRVHQGSAQFIPSELARIQQIKDENISARIALNAGREAQAVRDSETVATRNGTAYSNRETRRTYNDGAWMACHVWSVYK